MSLKSVFAGIICILVTYIVSIEKAAYSEQ